MASRRPIRFGFTGGVSSKRTKLLDSARAVESLGYSTFGLADHFTAPTDARPELLAPVIERLAGA